jgi:hypothetical protein
LPIQRYWQHWAHKIQDEDKQNIKTNTENQKGEQHKPILNQCWLITGVSSRINKPGKKYSFMTERRMYSYTTSVSAMSRTEHGTNIVGEMISPWGNQLPTMTYGRHSAGAVVLGLF